MENTNDFNLVKEKPKRSKLLTVLFILTMIGSGFGLLSSLYNLSFKTPESEIKNVMKSIEILEELNTDNSIPFLSNAMVGNKELVIETAKNIRPINISGLILYALSLFGALLMYNLDRRGFWFYLVSQVLLLFVTPIFVGFHSSAAIGIAFSAVITALFIILYASCVKQMPPRHL